MKIFNSKKIIFKCFSQRNNSKAQMAQANRIPSHKIHSHFQMCVCSFCCVKEDNKYMYKNIHTYVFIIYMYVNK